MSKLNGGSVVAQTLRDEGVKYLFCVNGGHLFPILADLRDAGIKLIHVRHEQAAAYAADGWARTSATPGVAAVTAGCGLTNAVTGLALAAATQSAVVCLSGQHPTTEDGRGSFQEAYGTEICNSFAKWTQRTTHWATIAADVRRAFREALAAPQGVTLVEIPVNVLYKEDEASTQRPFALGPANLRAAGNPDEVERAVELLAQAERPLLVGGDGVFWSQASEELRELAELTHTPVYTRRAAQGAVPEDHPLAVRGAFKKPFTGRADVVVSFGFRFWSGEKFGQPPTWSGDARHVQVDAAPERIGEHVPVQVGIAGDPKLVLRQMIDVIKERGVDFADRERSPWVREVAEARENFVAMVTGRANEHANAVPIHPDPVLRDLVDVIDHDATIIVDSFTLSGYVSHWFSARFPGQIVDAGPLAPVGHGVGMALGAQLARPGRQVVVVSGDGGLGIGGWDMETAARYDLPICTLLWNNSSWGPSFEQMPLLRGRTDPFDMLPDIRYDRVFAELGCHGEHVEHPTEIRPALERALASGKPSVVNVIGDKKVGHPSLGGNLLGSTSA